MTHEPMPNDPAARHFSFQKIAAAITCVVIVGAILGFALWRAQSRPALVAPPRPEVAAVHADAPAARSVPPRTPYAAAAAATDSAALAEASKQEHARVQAIVDRTRERFLARHATEAVDAAWSNTMERELASLADSEQIRSMNANVSNLEVDCRTSMCRVRGDVPSITAGDDWFTLYMTNVGGTMPEAAYRYVRNDDGSLKIEVVGRMQR